jgi:hypothetical protein
VKPAAAGLVRLTLRNVQFIVTRNTMNVAETLGEGNG